MLESAFTAFATFFATIGPIEAAVLYATFCPSFSRNERIAISFKAVAIATGILLFFAIFGGPILSALGVTLPALQTAGGIILLMIAIDMIFETRIAGSTISISENAEARARHEIAVFPLATPILAGPGALSAAMLLMASAQGSIAKQGAILVALLCVMMVTLVLMLAAQELREWIGITAQNVVMRVFGILLAAIAVQSLFNGVKSAQIFTG